MAVLDGGGYFVFPLIRMSTASTSAPPVLPANDFPDWLSPIVVKELRQGLKSKAFVAIATVLQGGMAFIFVLAALSGMRPGGGAVDTLSGFFWFMLWLPLIFFMPGRALQSVVEETKVQTLELVQMTRLRSLRIVFGKWLALSVQSLLLVLAILPYFVLRYFFGGVNLAGDLVTLASLLALSLVLTAAGLAASTLKPGLRIVLVIVSVLFLISAAQMIAFMSAFGRGGPFGGWSWPGDLWMSVLTALILLAAYVCFFLLQAAGHLSTQVESYSPQKRLLTLGAALVMLGAWLLHNATGIDFRMLGLLTPLVLWSVAEALVEVNDPHWSAGRRGWLRVWLRPGWAGGLFFAFAVFGIIYLGVAYGQKWVDAEAFGTMWRSFVIFMGAVLTPALILTRLTRVRQRLLLYWLFQLMFGLAVIIALIFSTKPGITESQALSWLAFLPPSTALACLQQEMDADFVRGVFPVTAVVSAGVLLLLLIRASSFLRQPAPSDESAD